MAVPAKSIKIAKILNKLSLVGAILLTLSVIVAISSFLFFSSELKKIDVQVGSLKDEISLLEKSEQKLILVKDKLGKVAYVTSLPSAEQDINLFKELNGITSDSSGSVLTEISIIPNKIEVSLSSGDSTALSSALRSFVNLKDYIKITLSSLGFKPSSGFLSNLVFESK